MKNFLLFLTGLLLILIEVFFTNFIFGYVGINLLLIYIILISLYIDRNYSLILGGILGLITDMISGGILGVTAVLLLAVSYFISSIEKSIFKEKKSIVCMLVFVVSFFYCILNAIVAGIFYVPASIPVITFKVVLVAVLNTLVVYLFYGFFESGLKLLKEE